MSSYLYDGDAISATVSSLRNDISTYRSNIALLKQLVNNIESSDAWVDKNVKSSFVSTANSYIRQYDEVIKWMESLVGYLSAKEKSVSSLEAAYS